MHWNFETITCPTVHAFPSDFASDRTDELQIITTLDKMRRCTVFDEESQKMLTAVTKKIEDLQIKCKKQASIKDFFL